jgi:hypothetical protein
MRMRNLPEAWVLSTTTQMLIVFVILFLCCALNAKACLKLLMIKPGTEGSRRNVTLIVLAALLQVCQETITADKVPR